MQRRSVLLLLALGVATWLALFGATAPKETLALAITQPPVPSQSKRVAQPPRASPTAKDAGNVPIEVLQTRATLIGGAHDGAATALFRPQSWAPPPPPPVAVKPAPPLASVAPPLPFTFLGKQFEDGKWQIFLGRGEQTFIATEQLVIDGTYRVDSIVPPQLNLMYLPLQKMQNLPIGGAN